MPLNADFFALGKMGTFITASDERRKEKIGRCAFKIDPEGTRRGSFSPSLLLAAFF